MSRTGMTKAALIVALSFLVPAAGSFAGEVDRMRLDQFRQAMKDADAKEQARWFDDLATGRVEGAASAILPYTASPDPVIRHGALAALGEIRDPKVFPRLLGLVKTWGKEPATLAEVIRAVGQYGNPRALKTLKSVGRKWLPRSTEVARAAAGALGNIPHRTSVELLMEMLAQTSPRLPSGSEKEISAKTHAILRASRPAIVNALQKLTGWDFEDAEAWQRFWKLEGRKWKPGARTVELAKMKVWTDPGYGFRIEKPEKAWNFDRTSGGHGFRIHLEREVNGIRGASVYVWAARDRSGLSPEIRAEQSLDRHRDRMKDVRETSVEIKPLRIGKVRGTVLRFVGRDGYGSATRVEERFINHDGMIFLIGSRCRTGLPDEVTDEVAKALNSFKLLD